MAKRSGALTGRGAKSVWIVLALIAAALALPTIAGAISIEIGGDVYADKCVPCHADYTDTTNPKYVFTHGNHITYQCSACHPEFPHKPSGIDMPLMKDCFNCHGLNHGPQGVIATGTCVDCHGKSLPGLRPAFHGTDWAGKPHVAPSNERLLTECSMCHTRSQCDECHVREGVFWAPPQPMIYDAGSGCLACHGSPNLIKSSSEGVVSFQVTGLEASAHGDLQCPECHIDFAYTDVTGPTNVWYVNAGLSCAEQKCHDHDEQATLWRESVHGKKIGSGDLTAATCGSCHGGHDIARLDTDAAKLDLHLAGEEMCAGCHPERWENYQDSYHGAAYKAGAEDAPACWDCHPAHEALASTDASSTVRDANLGETCASCHQHADATEDFAAQSGDMIHQQFGVRDENPLWNLLMTLTGGS
jgi:hypothetical protein